MAAGDSVPISASPWMPLFNPEARYGRRRRAVFETTSPPFDPDDFAGLVLWLDAADPSTLIDANANGRIGGWLDKSSQGNDLTASESSGPYYGDGIEQNGIEVPHGSKSQTGDSAASGFWRNNAFWAGDPLTVFVALGLANTQLAESGDNWILAGAPNAATAAVRQAVGLNVENKAGVVSRYQAFGRVANDSDATVYQVTAAELLGSYGFPFHHITYQDDLTDAWIQVDDGTPVSTSYVRPSITAPRLNITGRAVGNTPTSASSGNPNTGGTEILVYNTALSPSEIATVQQYLRAKWGGPYNWPRLLSRADIGTGGTGTLDNTSLPTFPDAAAGHLAIYLVGYASGGVTLTPSAGWTIIGTSNGGQSHRFTVFARILDGTSDDTLTLTESGTSGRFRVHGVLFDSHGVTNVATDIPIDFDGGSGTNPQSPALDCGSDREWMAVVATTRSTSTDGQGITAFPANCMPVIANNAAAFGGIAQAWTCRLFKGQVFTPGLWTSASRPWIALTLAVPGPP